MNHLQNTFFQLANLLVMDKQGAKLAAAGRSPAEAHRQRCGFALLRGPGQGLLKQPAEAANLLTQAYQLQKQDFQRRNYVVNLVLDLEEAGLGLEGYRAAPDKAIAFQTLARQLVARKQVKQLEALLQEHGKAQPGSDWQFPSSPENYTCCAATPRKRNKFSRRPWLALPIKTNGIFATDSSGLA